MLRRLRVITSALALTALCAGAPSAAAAGSPAPAPIATSPSNEKVAAGQGQGHISATDQLPLRTRRTASSSIAAQPAITTTPFLTRPYLNPHSVNSVFDHCHPDYSLDGRVCEYDGTVALKANGVDPTFPRGYAITPGGTDYLYYDGHNGWDLGLVYEPLLAAADGVVNIDGTDLANPGFGITVTIDHPDGLTTRYAHMSQVWVTHGQSVLRGEQIGVSGNTGASTGPHLHFGVYITSTWTAIDPWGWSASTPDPWPDDRGDLWLGGNPQNPVPTAPGTPVATAADASATVTWTPPAFDGGDPLQQYTVTASPGGQSTSVGAGTTTAVLTGLCNGGSYTFTVTATSLDGRTGAPSAPSAAVTPDGSAGSWPGRFHPVTPSRILDTRLGIGAPVAPVAGGQRLSLVVAGHGGVPPTGASAVVMNVTSVDTSTPSYVTLSAAGTCPAGAFSDLNPSPGEPAANLVEVPLSDTGAVSLFSQAGSTDLVADVFGWVGAPADSGPDGHYLAVPPTRILDTRFGTQGVTALAPGQVARIRVAGQGGLPTTGFSAVVMNVTATDTTRSGYLSVWPDGVPWNGTSNVNFVAGEIRANRSVVPLGAGGLIDLYNFAGTTNVVVDVVGLLTDGSATQAGGLFTGVTPHRVLDTRIGVGAPAQPLAGDRWLAVLVTGRDGIPAAGVRAVVVNLTITTPTAPGFVEVNASGTFSGTSDVNFTAGETIPNLSVAPVDANGFVHIYNHSGSTDVVADVDGWYGN